MGSSEKKAVIATLVVLFLLTLGILTQTYTTAAGIPEIKTSEFFPGGETTVSIRPFPSFMLPANNLSQQDRPDFHAGKALAHQPWIKAPTITNARDGLGPLYNARTCLACHPKGGRGRMPDDGKDKLFSSFVRLSLPGTDNIRGVVPEPMYGSQLQSQSIALSHQLSINASEQRGRSKEVAPEAYVYIDWKKKVFTYPDGETLSLRYPEIIIKNPGYGEFHPQTLMGLRNAPPMHGLGLLEMIAQKDIDANVDPDDADEDGISGRVNQVWDFDANKTTAGRFGLKANIASIRFQTAGAFANDIGISNPVFPTQPCTPAQTLCNQAPNGNGNDSPAPGMANVELPENLLTLVVNFIKSLGVPERRDKNDPQVLKGRTLFYQTGCNQCHNPGYVTRESKEFPHLSRQTIWPYTDLLLHDMGSELADGRPDYLATGSEWRTSPLWGVGLGQAVNGSDNLLHDGRAQNVEAAIVWHGGEAESIKQKFTELNANARQALVKFVESL